MDERYTKARFLAQTVKQTQFRAFMDDPNIVGVAFGRRVAHGEIVDEPAMVVYVGRKLSSQFIPSTRLLPRRVYVGGDRIEVDVLETGPIYPLSFTIRERPVPSGVSIGRLADVPIDAGTLGCLVKDNTDESLCILSNNHVMANENAAAIGDVIIQPGTIDGGTSPADDIATLKRFVTINTIGNKVDAAIARVISKELVADLMKNKLMDVPNPNHPAVGLLFAGSCNRTIINPIIDVLRQLNIQFLAGGNSTVAPDIGMNVEKVGRSSEYTTSTITEIDVTVTLAYNFGNATFDGQIATAWMSDPGDSGSIVCRGGSGGNEDHCGCGSTSAASNFLGTDLSLDETVAQEFRDRYLVQTRVGRYLTDLFFLNEDRLIERVKVAQSNEEDRELGRRLYDRHVLEVRMALLQPHRSEFRLEEQLLRDARAALERAHQYMNEAEIQATSRLFALANERLVDMTVGQVLTALNEEELLNQVKEIVCQVSSLEHPD